MLSTKVPEGFKTLSSSLDIGKNQLTYLLGLMPSYVFFLWSAFGGEVKIKSTVLSGKHFSTSLLSPKYKSFFTSVLTNILFIG